MAEVGEDQEAKAQVVDVGDVDETLAVAREAVGAGARRVVGMLGGEETDLVERGDDQGRSRARPTRCGRR